MEKEPRGSDLEAIRQRLSRVIKDDYIETWLSQPHAFLNHRSPIEVINGTDQEAKDQLMRTIAGLENPPAV